MRRALWVVAAVVGCGLIGCDSGPEPGWELDQLRQALPPAARRVRAGEIRDAAAARGLHNGILLAGIADIETGMSHCHHELTWACQGPNSDDCGGGPVVAGAGDGPCELEQGGLGMFQFDAGTYAQTLAREGERILSIAGNTEAAVDFVINMVRRSVYVPEATNDAEAIAWMNRVRPWNELWHPWVQTVTHYYNGCIPGRCGVYDSRYANYSRGGRDLLGEMGVDFWYGREPACPRVPADGAVIDETSFCFAAGGDARYWRNETAGHEGHLLWTYATDSASVANFAKWTFHFDEPGRYAIEVFTDGAFSESAQALYVVSDDGEPTLAVSLDQAAVDGWQALGEFDFAGVGTLYVGDNTGEGGSTKRLVADAVRLTRAEEIGVGGVGGAGGTGWAGQGGEPSVGGTGGLTGGVGGTGGNNAAPVTRLVADDGGCSCQLPGEPARGHSSALGYGALALALFGFARRRRAP